MDREKQIKKVINICYDCETCHVSFCTFGTDVTHCPFCGGNDISSRESRVEREWYYIPFQKNEDEVWKDYHKKVFWNPLIPLSFKKRMKDNKIKKLYIPAFLLDVKQDGQIFFLGGEKVSDPGKKNGIKTKKYDVIHTVKINYCDVFINVSSKIKDSLFRIICSYNSEQLKKIEGEETFSEIYLPIDLTIDEISSRGRDLIAKETVNIVKDDIVHPLKKLQDDHTTISFENTKQVLLPIYYSKIQYKQKEYYYIMNGETGKSCIELTIGIIELILFSVLLFGIIFMLGYVIAYFF